MEQRTADTADAAEQHLAALEAIRADKAALVARLEAAQLSVRAAEASLAAARAQAADARQPPPPPPRATEASELREGGDGGGLAWGPSYEGAAAAAAAALPPPSYTVALQPAAAALAPRAALGVTFTVSPGQQQQQQQQQGALPASSSPHESDFVALYRGARAPATPAAAHEEHVALEFTDGALHGALRLVLPSAPTGPYCLCYVAACGTVLCSVAIESRAEEAPAPPEPAPRARKKKPLQPQLQAPLLAPFLLETQPRISTYQLTVPLPAQLRGGGGGGGSQGGLPAGWLPGLAVEGDHSDPSGAAAPAALVLGMQLPRCRGCPAYDCPPAPAGAAAAAAAAAPAAPAAPAAASDVYALRVPLARRVESAKVITQVHSDHVSVRLPMYYAGSAVPDKPPSLVSLEEMAALRENAARAACRFCAAPLLHARAGAPARLRALKLPSEHWLEWTDFWVCHDAEDNALLPQDGVGEHCAIRGSVLVGESTLQVHPDDTAPGALAAARAEGGAAEARALECARCGSVVGSLTLPGALAAAAAGQRAALVQTQAQPHAEAPLPALFPQPLAPWPHSLTSSLHPTVRLHKEALAVASAGGPAAPLPPPAAGRPPRPANALSAYTLTSRIACTMLAAASALRHYSFAVIVAAQGAAGAELLCHIALVNWNTSVRVGLGSGHASSSALRARWVHAGDLPCLKVRYRADGGGGGGGVEPELLLVSPEEARELVAVLRESTSFLPPSLRELDGASIGYLPFMAAPVRVLTH